MRWWWWWCHDEISASAPTWPAVSRSALTSGRWERGARVDFRWFDEGWRWGAGGGPGGKAVIWCNELWLWLSVPAQLFPGEHLQHIQVTSNTIRTNPSPTNTTNNNCSVFVSDIKASPSFNIIFFFSSLASQWFRQLFLCYKLYWGWNEMTYLFLLRFIEIIFKKFGRQKMNLNLKR